VVVRIERDRLPLPLRQHEKVVDRVCVHLQTEGGHRRRRVSTL
jgi:hypothetical protein